MSKHTHTPGPWYPVMRMVEVEGNAPDICTTNIELFGQSHLHRSMQEQIANARLIAAAPNLLDALREMYHAFLDADNTHNDRQEAASLKACAAIFKATGGIT